MDLSKKCFPRVFGGLVVCWWSGYTMEKLFSEWSYFLPTEILRQWLKSSRVMWLNVDGIIRGMGTILPSMISFCTSEIKPETRCDVFSYQLSGYHRYTSTKIRHTILLLFFSKYLSRTNQQTIYNKYSFHECMWCLLSWSGEGININFLDQFVSGDSKYRI